MSSWSMSRRMCCAGRALARRAAQRGIVYSLAYGDQPALIAERSTGRGPAACGDRRRQGHQVPAGYHALHAGDCLGPLRPHSRARAAGGMNPQDVQFLPRRHQVGDRDGGGGQCLRPSRARRRPRLPALRRRRSAVRAPAARAPAASSTAAGMVEVVSSLERDGRPVTATCAGASMSYSRRQSDYVARCFAEYGLVTSPCGRYAALYRPCHLIGLELGDQRRLRLLCAAKRPGRRRVARRRRRHGQARSRRRRGARWRGWPLRVRPARAGRTRVQPSSCCRSVSPNGCGCAGRTAGRPAHRGRRRARSRTRSHGAARRAAARGLTFALAPAGLSSHRGRRGSLREEGPWPCRISLRPRPLWSPASPRRSPDGNERLPVPQAGVDRRLAVPGAMGRDRLLIRWLVA